VADASDIPILLYHVPKFCPVSFEPKLVHSLSSHPNIVGMKDTSADMVFLTTCLKERSDGFKIYVGTANILLAGLVLGADGGVLALANIAPQECVSLYGMVERGEFEAARKIQYRLLPVNQAVTSRFGIAGLKLAIDSIGLQGGEARRPIEPLSRNEEEELQAILLAGAIQSVTAEKN
jgi:4-hydroxy-2-oxoglutarate aldolase